MMAAYAVIEERQKGKGSPKSDLVVGFRK